MKHRMPVLGAIVLLPALVTVVFITTGNAQQQQQQQGRPQGAAGQQAADVKFIGTESCKTCHKTIYDVWLNTDHSRAFDKLPEDQQANNTCLGCHTTGAGQPGGYQAGAAKNVGLAGVGCEMCHGPGSGYRTVHARDKARAAQLGFVVDPTAESCLRCHAGQFPENHPPVQPFNWERMYVRIEHHLPKKG